MCDYDDKMRSRYARFTRHNFYDDKITNVCDQRFVIEVVDDVILRTDGTRYFVMCDYDDKMSSKYVRFTRHNFKTIK